MMSTRIGARGAVILIGLTACSGSATQDETPTGRPDVRSAPTERDVQDRPSDADPADDIDADTTPAAPQAHEPAAAVVVNIVDGDTFDVELHDGTIERIRPPQIDTPEHGECGYDESTGVTEDLLLGESVGLTPTDLGPDRDPYGRLLRFVDIDGQDFGEILVASGVARWSSQFADEDPSLAARYSDAEQSARTDSRGFWSMCAW